MTTTTMSPLVKQQFHANAAHTRKVLVDNMLVESEGFTKMQVLEEDSKVGALIVEGLVGRCGIPTANKRFYGESIMRREVKRLQERIDSRSLLSAVDHPADGKSRIREAGAICVGLRVESDGRVIGKYEVVEESTGGRDLAAFLRRGASIGGCRSRVPRRTIVRRQPFGGDSRRARPARVRNAPRTGGGPRRRRPR